MSLADLLMGYGNNMYAPPGQMPGGPMAPQPYPQGQGPMMPGQMPAQMPPGIPMPQPAIGMNPNLPSGPDGTVGPGAQSMPGPDAGGPPQPQGIPSEYPQGPQGPNNGLADLMKSWNTRPDNDSSKQFYKSQPGYQKLISDVEAGKITPDQIDQFKKTWDAKKARPVSGGGSSGPGRPANSGLKKGSIAEDFWNRAQTLPPGPEREQALRNAANPAYNQ